MQAELYDEVVKWYRVDNEQVIKLRHALTQVNNALDAVTGLDYEDYLKQRLIETRIELARQLSCATNKSQVCD
jgi:hypothetical protein